MKTFKIYDKENNKILNSLEQDIIPIELRLINENVIFVYDKSKYELLDLNADLCFFDKNGKKIQVNDFIKIDDLGIYHIVYKDNNIVCESLNEYDIIEDIQSIQSDSITYITSNDYLQNNNLYILKINCPNCLDDIEDIIDKNTKVYMCKSCNTFFEL